MSRLAFALLLAALTGLVVSRIETPTALGQDKKDKKTPEAAPEPAEGVKEDLSRVLPVFDPGSHTQPISAMGFTKDKTKLITVGQDFSIMVWNASTGERIDILRLPGYGREKGYDPGRWDIAAVSPDGTRVALGGQQKYLADDGVNDPVRLIVVDIPKRRVMWVRMAGALGTPVGALVFSPDGETLAVAMGFPRKGTPRMFLMGGLSDRIAKANPRLRTQDCPFVETPTHIPSPLWRFRPMASNSSRDKASAGPSFCGMSRKRQRR